MNKYSTTIMKPIDFHSNTRLKVCNNPKIAPKHKFKIGDVVRISMHKAVFDKGYIPNYSSVLFTITKINITNPVIYLLEDMEGNPIKGCFLRILNTKYRHTYLVKKIEKKRRRVVVKSLGFSESYNPWIDIA